MEVVHINGGLYQWRIVCGATLNGALLI